MYSSQSNHGYMEYSSQYNHGYMVYPLGRLDFTFFLVLLLGGVEGLSIGEKTLCVGLF